MTTLAPNAIAPESNTEPAAFDTRLLSVLMLPFTLIVDAVTLTPPSRVVIALNVTTDALWTVNACNAVVLPIVDPKIIVPVPASKVSARLTPVAFTAPDTLKLPSVPVA